MGYKEAITALLNMLKKHSLNVKEKKAVLTAIGVLDLAAIAKNNFRSKIEKLKARQEKDIT